MMGYLLIRVSGDRYGLPIEEVVETIQNEQPDLVFAPHVETSSGMLLPNDYLQQVAIAVHAHGGLFVLDCIASGTIWVDMQEVGVDISHQESTTLTDEMLASADYLVHRHQSIGCEFGLHFCFRFRANHPGQLRPHPDTARREDLHCGTDTARSRQR